MAKRRKGKKSRNGLLSLVTILMCVILAWFGGEAEPGRATNTYLGDGEAYIHFIDVGQGSSTLIQEGEKAILIDAGEQDYSESLVTYIKSCGVETLEYVIASHPHTDHIGGMTDVFDEFDVGEIVMPELSEINIPTSRLYEKFMTYIDEKDMSVSFGEVGDTYYLDSVSVSVMGPVEQVKDLNDMSLICKVNAYGTKAMVLGDAENQELSSVFETVVGEWKSDILVMGHHGSSVSVYEPFLNAVNADVAIVSCGKDNSYGHPHEEAVEYAEKNGLELYRTDIDGSIVFRCDADGYEKVD